MQRRKNTMVFTGLAWASMVLSLSFVIVGIYNAPWELVEKGYYAAVILWALTSAVTLSKVVRDNDEDKEIHYHIKLAEDKEKVE